MSHIPVSHAIEDLRNTSSSFKELFKHGSLSLEIYKPEKIDHQKPHDRDQVYIVISGEGEFYNEGQRVDFKQGDFLFVPSGAEHRFEKFTDDFATWVLFYGPLGGEANS